MCVCLCAFVFVVTWRCPDEELHKAVLGKRSGFEALLKPGLWLRGRGGRVQHPTHPFCAVFWGEFAIFSDGREAQRSLRLRLSLSLPFHEFLAVMMVEVDRINADGLPCPVKPSLIINLVYLRKVKPLWPNQATFDPSLHQGREREREAGKLNQLLSKSCFSAILVLSYRHTWKDAKMIFLDTILAFEGLAAGILGRGYVCWQKEIKKGRPTD